MRVLRGLTGAPRTRYFNDTELERLAKYQMVTLEKVRVLLVSCDDTRCWFLPHVAFPRTHRHAHACLTACRLPACPQWYTPCAAEGGYDVPQAPPSCDTEGKAEAVFQHIKRLSPNLTANLYWNSMFDFAFYSAHQGMLDLEAQGHHAFLRDEHGDIVRLCNDGNVRVAHIALTPQPRTRSDQTAGRLCGAVL